MATDKSILKTMDEERGQDVKRLDQPDPAWGQHTMWNIWEVSRETFRNALRTTSAEGLAGQHAARSLRMIPDSPPKQALCGKWLGGWLTTVPGYPPQKFLGRTI